MAIKQSERIEILREIEELARQLEESRSPRRSYELSQKILAASMRLPGRREEAGAPREELSPR